MNNSSPPTWLKSMQNGSIGEARTKAFLIDKFWILERSVDIEGADFLIQQKASLESLKKKDPLKLGIVQSKFFSSEKTTMTIKKDYLLDDNDESVRIFFLLCHTGTGDSQKMFFLTADDIVKNFKTSKSSPDEYQVSSKKILAGNYLIESKTAVLDRIHNTLVHANFFNGVRYTSSFFGYVRPEKDNIHPDYLERLPNNWGDIPEHFFKLKEIAKSGIWKLEEAAEILHKIVLSDDPSKALSLAEEFESEYSRHGGGYLGYSVSIDGELWDEDFFKTVEDHDKKLLYLKEEKLLDKVLKIRAKAEKAIYNKLITLKESKDKALVIDARIDPEALLLKKIKVSLGAHARKSAQSNIKDGNLNSIYHWLTTYDDTPKWRSSFEELADQAATHFIGDLVEYLTDHLFEDD